MGKSRRTRILDQAIGETGARLAAAMRARGASALSATIESLDNKVKAKRESLVRELGKFDLRRYTAERQLNRELAAHVLQDPISSVLGRLQKRAPDYASKMSDTTAAVIDLAGKTKPKPALAVISPATVARVAARIKEIAQTEPELASRFSELGLSIDEGTWLMFSVLDYSKAKSAAGIVRRIDRRGGILYEMLIPLQPGVNKAERAASASNAKDWILSEPGRFGATEAQKGRLADAVANLLQPSNSAKASTVFMRNRDAAGLAEMVPLAKNLWLMRLTDVHDEAGRLASDHIRALISAGSDGKSIDVVPSGFGESKFKSGYAKIIPQIERNLRRSRDTLKASNLPDLQGLEIRVRWGKTLVVIIQSEKKLPVGTEASIEGLVRKITRTPKMKVEIEHGATAAQAFGARRAVALFMALVAEPG